MLFFSRFRKDQRGSLLPTFAIGATAIFGFVGAAVDYSRGAALKASLQTALDSTALMLSQEADKLAPGDLSAKATAYFNAQFNQSGAKNVQVAANLGNPQQGSFTLHVTASASLDTTIARVIGQTQMNVAAAADVAWGIKKLELVLALDNTGSMAQNGKLAALKTAAHNLLNTLQQAGKQPGDVKVAIVPFDRMVNIGTGFKDEFWVDYSVKNIQKSSWNGCVIDRDQPNDVEDTTPVSTDYKTKFPAATCGSLTQVMPLSTDWTALHGKVDQMTAAGNTNVTIGLVWAWHALTTSMPFTGAAAPAPDLDKVIVLLTDGENTQNRWTTSSSQIDARTSAACANVKTANIKLYTVRVIDGNANLLRNCATKPSMYYDVQQADQLNGVFSSIAQTLANLRIAK
jgi:Flp pilus assembly protein TadG